jgi:hypothetical protein
LSRIRSLASSSDLIALLLRCDAHTPDDDDGAHALPFNATLQPVDSLNYSCDQQAFGACSRLLTFGLGRHATQMMRACAAARAPSALRRLVVEGEERGNTRSGAAQRV